MEVKRRFFRADRGELGVGLVEVIVALCIFGIVAGALVVASGGSMRMIGSSNGRQGATQLASKEMEHLRSTPYTTLGLEDSTDFVTAPGSPDEGVDAGGQTFVVPLENGQREDLVYGGTVGHHDRVGTGGFRYEIYRYVTDPAAGVEQRRGTVIVTWIANGEEADRQQIVLSSLFSSKSDGWGSSTSSTLVGGNVTVTSIGLPSSSVVSTSSTLISTTTTTLPCSGDSTPPWITVSINAGSGALSGYTSSNTLNLSLGGTDPCLPLQMQISIDGGVTWTVWEPWAPTKLVLVPLAQGEVTVSVRYRDGNGNVSAVASASIRIDTIPPTVPGGLVAVRSVGGATLTWTASSDGDRLTGYRVYRRVGAGGEYRVINTVWGESGSGSDARCITPVCTYVDTALDGGLLSSYTYYVAAFDAAGNESSRSILAVI